MDDEYDDRVPKERKLDSHSDHFNNQEEFLPSDDEVNEKEFTELGSVVSKKNIQEERVLPLWFLDPVLIENNFNDLKTPSEVCPSLDARIVKKLEKENIFHLFPVQRVVIPKILHGSSGLENWFLARDFCVSTPTGSGKTLAFVLPIVQVLSKVTSTTSIKALAILPVVELAEQVFKVFSTYANLFNLRVGKAIGSEKFGIEQSELVKCSYGTYQSKIDILVATPGRLLDHIVQTPGLDFSQLRFFVLDEADQLLSFDYGEVISRIQRHIMRFKHPKIKLGLPSFLMINDPITNVPKSGKNEDEILNLPYYNQGENGSGGQSERHFLTDSNFLPVPTPPLQTLLFSATLFHKSDHFQNIILNNPILFVGSETNTNKDSGNLFYDTIKPSELTEEFVVTDLSLKPLVLHHLLRKIKKEKSNFKALLFVNSVELSYKVHILLQTLSRGKYVVELFALKGKRFRGDEVTRFMKGDINVLVSTDATARGIDVPEIDCVISYEVPSLSTYTHRVGRTARAGLPGRAVSLVTQVELKQLKTILGTKFKKLTKVNIDEEKLKKYEPSFSAALEKLANSKKLKNASKFFRGNKKKQKKKTSNIRRNR